MCTERNFSSTQAAKQVFTTATGRTDTRPHVRAVMRRRYVQSVQILVSVTCSGGLLSRLEEPLQKSGTAPVGWCATSTVSTTVPPRWCHSPRRQRPQPALGLVTTVLGKTTGGSACLLSKRQAKPFITSLCIC